MAFQFLFVLVFQAFLVLLDEGRGKPIIRVIISIVDKFQSVPRERFKSVARCFVL